MEKLNKDQIRKLKSETLYRSISVKKDAIDKESRTVEVAFSSEAPYRRWFGVEVLGHDAGEIDMDFIASGAAPLLDQHDHSRQIGVIERAWIDPDRKGRALVRFGRGAGAEEFFQDVVDGVRRNISVGYRVHDMKLTESDDDNDTYRVTKWEPLEVSFVSVPADKTVGVGRSDEQETTIESKVKTMPEDKEINVDEIKKQAASEARQAEINRVRDITALGKMHKLEKSADEFINNGKPVELFREYALEQLAQRNAKPVETPDPSLGMSKKEVEKFSFLKLVRALADPKNAKDAGFEIEVCRAYEEKTSKTAKGFIVPHDVLADPNYLKRDLSTNVGSTGGYMVAENLLAGSFIDMLRNSSVAMNMGARTLTGLVGDADIPKQTGGATAYWINEGSSLTESTQALGQIRLSPKTVGCYTDMTRRMMLQASIDVESFVRADFALQMALAIDLAALNGAGASGEPRGILQTTGIGSVTLNATNAPDWGDIVDMETAVSADNALFGTLGYVTNATIGGKMKQTEKASSTGKFIWEGGELNGYRCMISNQIPAKYMIFGNWADLIIGMWSGLDVTVDNTTLGTSGGTRIICFQDVDVVVRHAESFAKGYKV